MALQMVDKDGKSYVQPERWVSSDAAKATDLERFIELYKGFGVELKPKPGIHRTWYPSTESPSIDVCVLPWDQEEVYEDADCYSVVEFHPDGSFWEQHFICEAMHD